MKKVAAVLLSLMIPLTAVSAKDTVNCEVDKDGWITISGILPSGTANKDISVIICYPDKDKESIDETNANDYVAKSDQIKSSENGEYTLNFRLDGESGFYNLYLATDDKRDKSDVQFLFSNPEEGKVVLEQLNVADSSDAFYNLIYGGGGEGRKKLGFFLATPDTPGDRAVSDFLYNSVQNKPFSDTEEALKRFRKAYNICRLNNGADLSVNDASSFLQVEEETFIDFFNMPYITDKVKKEMLISVKNRNFSDEQAYSKALLEQVVLKTVKYADGYGRIENILKAYQRETGIDITGFDSENYFKVLGKDFGSYAALKEALKTDTPTEKEDNKYSISGTGGAAPGGDYKNDIPAPLPKEYFDDLGEFGWAKDKIEALAKREVISGKGNKKFCPSDKVKREEFVVMVVRGLRMEGTDALPEEFSDVPGDSAFAPYIRIAVSNGIISGVGDGSFGMGEYITRQDIAVILSRALNLAGNAQINFADDGKISDYAKEAVYKCRENGIISGYAESARRLLSATIKKCNLYLLKIEEIKLC